MFKKEKSMFKKGDIIKFDDSLYMFIDYLGPIIPFVGNSQFIALNLQFSRNDTSIFYDNGDFVLISSILREDNV